MIGKVTVRELTPDEVASQCDAWREFCLFMEGTDEDSPEEVAGNKYFAAAVIKKFRELRDKMGGPGHPPRSNREQR